MPCNLRDSLTPKNEYLIASGGQSRALAGQKRLGHIDGRTILCPSTDLDDIGRNFIYTEVGSGASAGVVQASTSTLPRRVKFTTGASQHNNQQIQWAKAQTASTTAAGTVTAYAPFLIKASPIVAGDRSGQIGFKARFQITTTMNNAAFFIGLAAVDTTILASSALAFTDGVGFLKASGAATVAGCIEGSSSNTATTLLSNTLVISTWYELEFLINERSAVTYWINGVMTGETTMTNLPANTVSLCPTVAISAGTAAAATLELEALTCIQDGGF